MTDDLKPCPFCGGPAERMDFKAYGMEVTHIFCRSCDDQNGKKRQKLHASLRVMAQADRPADAIAMWNHRAPVDRNDAEGR